MSVADTVVVQTYNGTTKALFAFPDDYRFRLARPSFPRADQVVTFWKYPDGAERVLTEAEIEDDGEFLWCKPLDIAVWDDVRLDAYRLTVNFRGSLLQQWDPSPNSPVDLPAQASRLDRLFRAVQALAERVANSLGFHPQETGGVLSGKEVPLAGLTIPLPNDRKNRALGFDDDGRVSMLDVAQLSLQVTPGIVTLDADFSGAAIDTTEAVAHLKVVRSGADDTTHWELSAVPSTGILGLFVDHDTYQVTGADRSGHVDFFATKAGAPPLTARFSVLCFKQGDTGLNAVTVSIQGPQVFLYPKGAAVPSPSTPKTLTAVPQNLAGGSVAWERYYDPTPEIPGGGSWVPLADEPGQVSGTTSLDLTVSHSAAAWVGQRQLRLRVTISSVEGIASDEFSLYKVFDGVDGYTVILTNENHGIACDSSGVAAAGEVGPGGRAATDVIAISGRNYLVGVTTAPGPGEFRVSILSAENCTASVEGIDRVQINSVSASGGTVVVQVELEGTTPDHIVTKEMTWAKVLNGHDSNLLYTVIESSHGSVFKPGQSLETTLSAHVFDTTGEITDSIPSSRFRWRRRSVIQPSDDETWNAAHLTGFMAVTITVFDVTHAATFFCDITD